MVSQDKIVKLSGGFCSAVYLLTGGEEKVVLKVGTDTDVKVMRHEKMYLPVEAEMMKILNENTNILMPRLVFYDDSLTLCDVPYFFMSYIDGSPLMECSDISEEERHDIKRQIGLITRKICEMKADTFGIPMIPESYRNTKAVGIKEKGRDKMTRKEKAMQNFYEGYNCTQSVVLAFEDIIPFEKEALLCMVSPLGGGMGRLREVCGSVSGMFLVLGMLCGYSDPKAVDEKKALYAKVQQLAEKFEEQNGSIVCRELLGLSEKRQEPNPEARTEAYYKKRPCPELIGMAAEIIDEFIKENHLIAEEL